MRVHRTDLVSFAFGLLFVALAAWWLLAQMLGLILPPVGWFLAGGLILIGSLGLIGALRSGRHAGKPDPATPNETETGPAAPSGTDTLTPTEWDTLMPSEPDTYPAAEWDPPAPAEPGEPAKPAEPGEPAVATPEPGGERTLDLSSGDEPSPGQRGPAA
ncbi:hypothetical protein Jiend_36930 [Micromonospora endophytica]|nr:hypothetical protein Jiend_36930 [Micromonospora endophytica]